MKLVITFLLGAALMISQAVVPQRIEVKPPCKGCLCGGACCVGKAESAPTPAPAAPANPSWEAQVQVALLLVVWQISPEAGTPPTSLSSAYLFFGSAGAIPLYEWNCAYVI